jgi:hypothetical protein
LKNRAIADDTAVPSAQPHPGQLPNLSLSVSLS